MKNIFFYLIVCVSLFFFPLLSKAATNSSNILPTRDTTQQNEYYNKDRLRYENFVYKNNIKTVMLHKEGFELSSPFLELNTNDRLKLSFDDMDVGTKDYSYSFIHCDASWKSSNIQPFDYMQGYLDDRITDYQYSFNTIQKYTHYSLVFPNENIQLSKSGNYILKVYLDNNPEQLVLTRRFIVYEQKVTVDAAVHRAVVIEDRNAKQKVDFTILHNSYPVNNPFDELKVVLVQNERWDNAITDLKPIFIKDNELIYNYETENVFNGGNEFRFFDFRSLRYQTERTKAIIYDSSFYHIVLLDDERRSSLRYLTVSDIDGKCYIKNQDGTNSDNEADYAFVHFSLPYNAPPTNGNFYIMGALTDWNLSPESQLKYNYDNAAYESTLYLKQGYYNYEYVFLKDGEKTADESIIEGNHVETENNYMIFVYHRALGSRYDQVIGLQNISSRNIY